MCVKSVSSLTVWSRSFPIACNTVSEVKWPAVPCKQTKLEWELQVKSHVNSEQSWKNFSLWWHTFNFNPLRSSFHSCAVLFLCVNVACNMVSSGLSHNCLNVFNSQLKHFLMQVILPVNILIVSDRGISCRNSVLSALVDAKDRL